MTEKSSDASSPFRKRHKVNGVIVSGVLLSVGLGVLAYFLDDRDFSLGLIVGLVGLVVSLQVESISRLESASHKTDRHSRLMASLEEVDWLLPEMTEIAKATRQIERHDELSQLKEISKEKVRECSNSLQSLRLGEYKVPAHECDELFRQTRQTTYEIKATSVAHIDLSWWSSDVGERYFAEQKAAVQERGVIVERVFIFEEWTPELAALAKRHSEAGFNVSGVPSKLLPPELRLDIIIWDDRFAYRIELNSDGHEIANVYTVNGVDINSLNRVFTTVHSRAKPLSGLNEQITPSTPELGSLQTLE